MEILEFVTERMTRQEEGMTDDVVCWGHIEMIHGV